MSHGEKAPEFPNTVIIIGIIIVIITNVKQIDCAIVIAFYSRPLLNQFSEENLPGLALD